MNPVLHLVLVLFAFVMAVVGHSQSGNQPLWNKCISAALAAFFASLVSW